MSGAKLIMLVDDDWDFLEPNRQLLEAVGYRTACFSDPREALRAAEAERPDLIISDLMMKSLDSGFALAREAKSRWPGMPVILVTAASSQRGFDFRPRGREDLEAMKVDAFFDKPVDPTVLVAKVKELLG